MRASIIAAGALVALLLAAGAGWYVRSLKADSDALMIERAATAGANKAGAVVVGAIDKLRPRFTTITNEVHRATETEARYRDAACFHSDAVWLQLSAAYQAIGGPALDRTGLPPAAPASGSQPGADHAGPD
jgi:hypothetical protein